MTPVQNQGANVDLARTPSDRSRRRLPSPQAGSPRRRRRRANLPIPSGTTRAARRVAPLALAACTLAPALSFAAGVPGPQRVTTLPRPVAVYVGRQLVAAGQRLSNAIRTVRTQVPFTVRTPQYVPAGYRPMQLAITPRQRDVSLGFSTLSYALWRHGQAVTAIGFEIDQAPHAIPVVGDTHVTAVKVGPAPATLHQFKAAHQDIMILTWVDGQGNGYDLVTNAAVSHLAPRTIVRIAASLR